MPMEKNPTVQVQTSSQPFVHSSQDENANLKYMYSRIQANYEQKSWNKVIEDVLVVQHMTKTKKLELIKIKAEIQLSCHAHRTKLMDLLNNNNFDDDEQQQYEQLFLNITAKNLNELMNSQSTNKSNKRIKTSIHQKENIY